MFLAAAATARAQELPPELTQPVNDFANVIDEPSKNAMESLIRSLQQASGDVVVVATIQTFKPYGDIREYAVKMFENHGKGIGQRGKDNGLLVLLAVDDRQVRVEVGYDLEQFITDGFSGEVSRQYMAPEFRRGAYGAGLLAGVSRIIARIAQGRNVTLQGVRPDNSAPSVGSGGNRHCRALHRLHRHQRDRPADAAPGRSAGDGGGGGAAGTAASDRLAAAAADSAAAGAVASAADSADSAAAAAAAAAAAPAGKICLAMQQAKCRG